MTNAELAGEVAIALSREAPVLGMTREGYLRSAEVAVRVIREIRLRVVAEAEAEDDLW